MPEQLRVIEKVRRHFWPRLLLVSSAGKAGNLRAENGSMVQCPVACPQFPLCISAWVSKPSCPYSKLRKNSGFEGLTVSLNRLRKKLKAAPAPSTLRYKL